jgi:hypothetical protein
MRMDVQEPAAEDLEIFGSLGQALSVSLERRSALNALWGTECKAGVLATVQGRVIPVKRSWVAGTARLP